MKLKLSDNLSLPIDSVTQTIAILAKRRAGKSYTARRFVEQLFTADQQIVIVDPKGDWWGLRSSANGKHPGLPIVILGGEHGDVPLEKNSGEIVAKLVVEERVSVLLDLSMFRKSELAIFMTDFLENLYRLKAREQYRTPVMLMMDEADAIAPQKPQHGEERMLGAAEDIVRRGGQRGIGCTLVTQRSAVLNKNVLTQTQILVALRTIAPQDLKAMDEWIDVHGAPEQRKTLMQSLPSLPTGDAWFWSPGWPSEDGIFKRVHVLPIDTFDSGATPKAGEKRIMPKNLADVDLGALSRQMAATIEKAKADDPKLLRARIVELEHAAKSVVPIKTKTRSVEVPILRTGEVKQLKGFIERIESCIKSAGQTKYTLESAMDAAKEISANIAKAIEPHKNYAPQPCLEIPIGFRAARDQKTKLIMFDKKPNDMKLPIGETKILSAIIQNHDCTRQQITVLTGYKRSSRDTYLQRLSIKGLIEISGDHVYATAQGSVAIEVEALPTGAELRDYWLNKLPEGESKIMSSLLTHYPEYVTRDYLSETTGYKRSSRDTYLQRLSARQLVVFRGRGEVTAAKELFS